eukprot:TRINITY_DN2401_c0_g1_i1.p1 TRINITY_DN2401_c0_g1~~TRINITY_DN2401_c0_g1_i1.p1  ORF type:complete len:640 (-),score=154.70 TRINITY_DN2401_c0_g1_i1:398-2317(-)
MADVQGELGGARVLEGAPAPQLLQLNHCNNDDNSSHNKENIENRNNDVETCENIDDNGDCVIEDVGSGEDVVDKSEPTAQNLPLQVVDHSENNKITPRADNESELRIVEDDADSENEIGAGESGISGGGGIGFTLGAESKNEIMDSLAFTLQHSENMGGGAGGVAGAGFPAHLDQEVINLDDVPVQPAPIWGHAPGSGWSRSGSAAGSVGMYSGRYSAQPPYDQDFCWDDNISDLLAIRRVDSKDVVYENKKKTTKIIGHYVMGDVLGEGSYAKVKEAIDQNTLCRRAVKIMKKRKLRKIPNGEQNVQREIELLQALSHNNILKLIEVMYNDEKGKIYMVLEYCCAVLQDMLEQSPEKKFPMWQAHDYFTQLLTGLEYLHSKGIIHKDLKPGNLLLDRAGVLKIADFGVCEQLDMFAEQDWIKTSQGTPSFQPPEVATGVEKFSGEKLDIWSCGVTLFNFVTGDYPFQGDTIFKLFENIAKGDYSFPCRVDRLLESLISELLALEPADRPNVRQALQHDWCKKRYPKTGQAATAPPYHDDPLLSTTVLPYLENLHYPSQEPDLITEHELNRQQEEVEDDIGGSGSMLHHPGHPHNHHLHRLHRKKIKDHNLHQDQRFMQTTIVLPHHQIKSSIMTKECS